MENNQLENNLFQFIAMMVLSLLIFVRLGAFILPLFIENQQDSSIIITIIWIVNYLGMMIACISLFAEKCKELSKKEHELHHKYKPFRGLTNLVAIILTVLLFGVWGLQSTAFKDCLNDVITLFALLFSVSKDMWSSLLTGIAKTIK